MYIYITIIYIICVNNNITIVFLFQKRWAAITILISRLGQNSNVRYEKPLERPRRDAGVRRICDAYDTQTITGVIFGTMPIRKKPKKKRSKQMNKNA